MVKKIINKGKEFYQCEACGFYYKTRKLAEKCEDFCRKNHACNTEIIKHSVQLE